MDNILEKYGLKEVADVTFYKIDENGDPTVPVLYLDTLKVSTVEQTAENTSARGGKGNVELVSWDYNKEISLNLEDALFSAKSMAVMFGDADGAGLYSEDIIKKTWNISGLTTAPTKLEVRPGVEWTLSSSANYYKADGSPLDPITTWTKDAAFVVDNIKINKDKSFEIEIGPSSFPGNYYVTADTFIRSETTGDDEFFQLIIRKAKMLSDVTLTMEAKPLPLAS